ncbi:BCLAF1 and THRAP3 family member 3 isoform X1 [Amblyraja radiata]|uniref:BCLAF1 and THRAP3 family member 3 isoform X1 n=2 Tax=Amblyraja radiata TaxID=386614 RepID=UPI001402F170|nr:BCLAF1 and THRAP3 family member 3 isoform X1 [Amblyraja radiata]
MRTTVTQARRRVRECRVECGMMVRSRSRSPRWKQRVECGMMVRSRSRSPRWKHRSISPTCVRSQEYHVERRLYQSHTSESRAFSQSSGRPTQWRAQQDKWNETGSVESRSGNAQYGKVHYEVFEYGHPSPIAKKVGAEHTTGRHLYPHGREGNRSHALLSKSAEENPYHDHDERHHGNSDWPNERHHGHSERHDHDEWRNDHDERHYQSAEIVTHYKLPDEKSKTVRSDPQITSYDRPSTTSYGYSDKWRDTEGLRSHNLHEERHSDSLRSPGRQPEEFLERNSHQKRYPEEDDVKGCREASGRGWVPGKHETVDHDRDLKWRGEKNPHYRKACTSTLYNDSEGARIKDVSRAWYSDSDRFDECVQVKSGFAHSQKYPEMHSSEHHQSFSSERQQRYSSKDKEYTTASSSTKEVSRFHSNSRRSGTDVNKAEGHNSVTKKYPVLEHYFDRSPRANKKEVSPRYTAPSATRGRVERGKEFRNRSNFSKDQRDDAPKRLNHRSYQLETSRCTSNNERGNTTESLTIKLDMKKTVNKCSRKYLAVNLNICGDFSRPTSSHASERLMSRDLVSVGKKRDEFHHVFEHMGSSLKANPNISSGEFAQEIITLVHQIKGDQFKPSDVTLHNRFSKLQNAQSLPKDAKHLGPEIHRRIDMSLADLHSRERKPVGRKTSTWVAVNPDDLRHDIERRRKERLRDKYEVPYQTEEHKLLCDRSERHEKSCSSNRMKTSRDLHFKEPPTGLMEHRMRLAKKPFPNFSKEYTTFGRKKSFSIESKYRRLYGVGFGRTNPREITKHFREGLVRKRRDERELPSSTTDK